MADAAHHLGILLFDDVEELDAVGPYEVLASWTRDFPDDGWSVTTMSFVRRRRDRRQGARRSSRTSPSPTRPRSTCSSTPGASGRAPLLARRRAPRLAARAARARCRCSRRSAPGRSSSPPRVCSRDRPATTHWASLDTLGELDRDDRGAPRRAVRRRRGRRHRRGRLRGHRHGAAPRRAARSTETARARCARGSSTTRTRRSEVSGRAARACASASTETASTTARRSPRTRTRPSVSARAGSSSPACSASASRHRHGQPRRGAGSLAGDEPHAVVVGDEGHRAVRALGRVGDELGDDERARRPRRCRAPATRAPRCTPRSTRR